MKDLKERLDPVTYRDLVRQIFLHLDLASLKSARQVCKEWDGLVMGEVWGSGEGRWEVERKLSSQWKHGEPVRREIKLSNVETNKVYAMCCDERNIAVFLRNSEGEHGTKHGSNWHLKLYNTTDLSLVYRRHFADVLDLLDSLYADMGRSVVATVTK